MLRLIVLALALLNAAYFAWGQGWLLAYGLGPTPQHEPQRLAQQIQPQALEVISGKDATPSTLAPAPASTLAPASAAMPASVSASASATTAAATPRNAMCLQSGVLGEAQANTLRRVLATALPPGAWTLDSLPTPERWIIYMGKYANAAELDKKRAQLAGLRLRFEPLQSPALAPGLSLGAYPSQDAATTALEALALRGVRTARVLQENTASKAYRLRLPAVDDTLQKQLTPVRTSLVGKPLTPCAEPTTALR